MGRGTTQFASTVSSNTLDFTFPYTGTQHARLTLRKHPRMGLDVIVQIERGQFVCRIDGCALMVRFDEGQAERFYGAGAADGTSTILFIRPSDRFMARVRKAKRVRIEAQFYQQGIRVLDFPADDLGPWPPSR